MSNEKQNYNILDGSFKRKFVIPVGNLSKEEAESRIKEIMSEYNEVVDWDESNELFLPNNVDCHKEIYYPVKDKDGNIYEYNYIHKSNSPTYKKFKKFIVPVGNKKDNFLKRLFKWKKK